MVKLENLCHAISAGIPELEKRIEQYQRDMEQSKQEYEKPFTQEEELNEKVARLNELNVQLDLENGKTEEADLCETQDNARVAEPEFQYGAEAFEAYEKENTRKTADNLPKEASKPTTTKSR